MSRDKTTIETLKACREYVAVKHHHWVRISQDRRILKSDCEQCKLLADLDALIAAVESAGEPVTRYTHAVESEVVPAKDYDALLLRLAGLEQGGIYREDR